jgi:hypothetical protein
VGLFLETYYSDGTWGSEPTGERWLGIRIHDSDFATVTYSPAPAILGLFYLGFQPRDYFENPTESGDVFIPAEAQALATWAWPATPDKDALAELMAEDGVEDPIDDFVEDTVVRLLELLGLPVPAELEVE